MEPCIPEASLSENCLALWWSRLRSSLAEQVAKLQIFPYLLAEWYARALSLVYSSLLLPAQTAIQRKPLDVYRRAVRLLQSQLLLAPPDVVIAFVRSPLVRYDVLQLSSENLRVPGIRYCRLVSSAPDHLFCITVLPSGDT